MTAILLTGALSKITQRTSKSGTPFVMATVTVTSGAERMYWRVFIFAEDAQAEITRLTDGEYVAIQGTPKFEIWKPEGGGEPRMSLAVTADRVLALRQPPKSRQARTARPPQPEIPMTNLTAHAGDGADAFNDKIPF